MTHFGKMESQRLEVLEVPLVIPLRKKISNGKSNPCGPMRFALDCKSIYATHNNGCLAYVATLNLTDYEDAWMKHFIRAISHLYKITFNIESSNRSWPSPYRELTVGFMKDEKDNGNKPFFFLMLTMWVNFKDEENELLDGQHGYYKMSQEKLSFVYCLIDAFLEKIIHPRLYEDGYTLHPIRAETLDNKPLWQHERDRRHELKIFGSNVFEKLLTLDMGEEGKWNSDLITVKMYIDDFLGERGLDVQSRIWPD